MRMSRRMALYARVGGAFSENDFTFLTSGGEPAAYQFKQQSGGAFLLEFLVSGIFTPKKNLVIDYSMVGGGGGGGGANGSGGGSGRTVFSTAGLPLTAGTPYEIIIGDGGAGSGAGQYAEGGAGGDTSAFGATAKGGAGGLAWAQSNPNGGSGGSGGGGRGNNATVGGAGGTNGGDGAACKSEGGAGQGTTTYDFGDETLTLRAGGGGGGGGTGSVGAAGGAGGGGSGGTVDVAPTAGAPNYGGGGGGYRDGGLHYGDTAAAPGGCGVVVIRSHA